MSIDASVGRGLSAASTWLSHGDRSRAADSYLEVARAYAHAGQSMQAVAVGFAALQTDSARFVALAIGEWVRWIGEPSLVLLRRAIELHLEVDRIVDACALLELVVAIVPRCVESRIQLTELLMRCGRRRQAMSCAAAALEMFEDDGNNRGTIAVAQHILSFDPRQRDALHALVRAQMRVGEHAQAADTVAVLLTLDASDPVALEALARRMIQAGDPDAGLRAIRQLVDVLGWAEASRVLARAQRWCANEDYRAAVSMLRRQSDRHEVVQAEIVELDVDDLLELQPTPMRALPAAG